MNIGSHAIDIQNRDKLFFPEKKVTKGGLIEYYDRVADRLLPYLNGRPLTLSRFPDGMEGEGFYQKELPDYFPDWIETAEVKKKEGGTITQVLGNDKATLIYLVNQGTLSFHPWLSRASDLDKPDKLVFDLDPPEGQFNLVIKAAKVLRSLLEEELDLAAFVMTTGSEGMHVVCPLKPEKGFDEVRAFAQKVAEFLTHKYPDSFTTATRKEQRNGRLFLDYLRNAYGQTAISPYSARAVEEAGVATPLSWDELNKEGLNARSYHLKNIFKRVSHKEDPWTQFRNKAKNLEGSSGKLAKLS
ncbi:MAG TPA: non-homologous end-joining DNA ligase [Fodinibius sp.]|nr:non-homologous end-joining DNA ligase [Fodinibius sp.]